ETLFPIGSPLGQSILIGSGKYRVVGVLAEKGNGLGFGGDRTTVIPISSARQYYAGSSPTYMISILTSGPQHMDPAIGEAAGLFRIIRGDRLEAEHSFGISRSDNLTAIMIDNLAYVQIAAVIIAIITLLGAAIGLLNIMLVSVTERTKEIGTRMAVGAKQLTIRHQFLVEAVVICQIGALVGILFGMVMGNLVSFMVGSSFVVPWTWMMLGVSLCIGVGLMAGYYPAKKASQLDPIDALRYE
ncbi:MAG: FtsX-like permease family protein, partial [Bacteroidota bacterium]